MSQITRSFRLLLLILLAAVLSGFAETRPPNALRARAVSLAGEPWINELHYDNASVDVDEGVEIAGMAGIDLSIYQIVLYNGTGGVTYTPLTNLSGVIDDEGGSGGGAVWFPIAGLQNGAPDGLALVNTSTNTVVQFLSYEGSFAATNGPANGQTSTDIGVQEGASGTVGQSLQLTGTGSLYADFTWTGPLAHSRGSLNVGQTFQMAPSGNLPPDAGMARVGVTLPTSGGATCPGAVVLSVAVGDVFAIDDVITIAGIGVPVPTSSEVSDDTTPDNLLSVRVTATSVMPGQCTTSVTITYVVIDADGAESAPRTDSFVIVDDTPPTLSGLPVSVTYATSPGLCGLIVPDLSLNISSTDACGGAVVITQTPAIGTQIGVGTTQGSFSVQDACGNTSISSSYAIIVQDSTAPQLTCPGAITVNGCNTSDLLSGGMTNLPFANTVTGITDTAFIAEGGSIVENCGVDSIDYVDAVTGVTCSLSVTRTFTAFDAAGNSVTCTQVILIEPQAITFSFVPADTTVDCGTDFSPTQLGLATATSMCATSSTTRITFFDQTIQPNCASSFDFVRTFTATDTCGTTATVTQSISVRDTVPPIFNALPGSLDQTVLLSSLSSFATGSCATDIDLTLLATTVQTSYAGSTPLFGPVATDCSAITYAVSASFGLGSDACQSTILISVTATDACNQVSNFLVTLTVNSTTPSTLPQNPPVTLSTSAGFNCLSPDFGLTVGTVFAPGAIVMLDNQSVVLPARNAITGCLGAMPTFTLDQIQALSTSGCTKAFGLNFTFDPDCAAQMTQPYVLTINLVDDTAPIVTAPPAVTLSCGQDPNDVGLTGTATATDNCAPITAPLVATGMVFINEIHYDNAGSDVGESVEVAGPAGTDLSGYSIVLYNGSTNTAYTTIALSGLIDDEGGSGFGALAFAVASGIQNGDPDGIALCGPMGILEFLSYEGTMTAVGGCAAGIISTDIGVAETNTTPIGTSLQRIGSGTNGIDFSWVAAVPQSAGSLNTNQTLTTGGGGNPGGGGPTGGPITTTFTDQVVPGSCASNSQILRTFSAVDSCGNVGTALQVITVVDSTGPVFVNAPGSLDMSATTSQLATAGLGSCAASVDAATIQLGIQFALLFNQPGYLGLFAFPTASDVCGTSTLSVASVTTANAVGLAPCALDIIVTYRAVDNCGNASTFQTTLTVNDNEAPVVSPNFMRTLTVACGQPTDTTVTGFPVFYDNCGSSLPVTAGAFINEIHYDNAGVDLNEFVEVAGPAGTGLAGWSLVLYNGANNAPYNTLALSGVIPNQGGGGGALAFYYPSGGIQNGNPDGVALIDNLGNVVDFISYGGAMTAASGPAAGVAATPIGVVESGNASAVESLQRTGAGSRGSDFTFVGPRPNSPGSLNAGQAFLGGQAVMVSFGESFLPNPNCTNGQIIERIFTASDGCGNVSTVVQTITVTDTLAPVYTSFPSNTSIDCAVVSGGLSLANLSAYANTLGLPTVNDGCAGALTPVFTDAFTPSVGACTSAGTFTRTFAALNDGCGNILAARTLTITVADNAAPQFVNFPANGSVDCSLVGGVVTLANLTAYATGLGLPTVTDNCSSNLVAAFTDVFAPTCASAGVFTRTFTAVPDGCGNVLPARVQTITVIDTTAPTFVGIPVDTIVACGAFATGANLAQLTIFANARGTVSVTDNCVTGLTATFVDAYVVSPNCPSAGTFTRNYASVTDGCGNTLPARTYTITVVDTVGPVISGLPSAVDFQCESGLPDLSGLVTDDCGPVTNLSFTDTDDLTNAAGLGLPGSDGIVRVVERVYSASDACGNVTTATRALRLVDFTAPEVVSCPTNIGPVRARASGLVAVTFTAPDFTDNCEFSVSASAVSGDIFEVGITTVTYVATDLGGNEAICSFTIEVVRSLEIACDAVDISIPSRGDLTAGDVNFPYAETTCDVCPQGASLPDLDYLGYFQGHRYYVSAPGIGNGWIGAQRYGIDLGARLVTIDSEDENRFLQGEIDGDVHIGLTRDAGAADWRTTFGSTDYRNWAVGEPQADPLAKYGVLRKRDGKHLARRDSVMAYVLEFPCVDFEVAFLPTSGLYGNGANTVQYVAKDQCGNVDTCDYLVNVLDFNVLYCAPAVAVLDQRFPREEQLSVTGVALGAFAKTILPDAFYLHDRDTIAVTEDVRLPLRLRAETSGVEDQDFTAYWRVWIDANRDGDFYDAGELVFQAIGGASLDSSLIVPTALGVLSPTRLRVAVGRYDWPEPCGATPFVDHEDFTVRSNIVRAANLTLSAKLVANRPVLQTTSISESAEVDRYLLLRGSSEDRLSKYDGWEALLRNGERQVYSLTDRDPTLRAFYQSISLSATGEILERSNVVEVLLPVRRVPGVKTYPNPAAYALTVERDQTEGEPTGDWNVLLHDALGRRVLEKRWPAGAAKLQLTLPSLPSGTYLLQTVDPSGGSETQRVIIDQQAVKAASRA